MKKLASLVVFMFSLYVQAGENLTEKYELSKSQIIKASVTAYSNTLVNLMVQAKQKADLDSYLSIQAEQKRMSSGGLVDDGQTNSIESVASIAKKIVVERDTKIGVQLRQYVSQLELLLKQSMLADKIDEAKVIKEVLDKAKVELSGLKEQTLPKVVTNIISHIKTMETKEELDAYNGFYAYTFNNGHSREISITNGIIAIITSSFDGVGYSSKPEYSSAHKGFVWKDNTGVYEVFKFSLNKKLIVLRYATGTFSSVPLPSSPIKPEKASGKKKEN